jgi:hypothetical protein
MEFVLAGELIGAGPRTLQQTHHSAHLRTGHTRRLGQILTAD